ncbi:MAG TPA: aminotransferase class I/II-fold pyridoxal phosphate-dependent enzyme [Solirubrobacteraceae bacterium]|nr:aminotransferase class I/II-fold pyridoxal phosphate-dependent enzyme [Solirubrobacteraceae bacterium]
MLSLPPEEMRRLGYRVVDRIVEHYETVGERPPVTVGDAAELRAALGGPPPEAPGDPDKALDLLLDHALRFVQHGDHPRFFARIGSPSNFASVLADTAASGLNVFAASWTGGSGPATVELVVLDWLRELCGMPEGTEGVLVSGGSVGSLVALAAARTARFGDRAPEDAVAYVSSEGHVSIPRALRVLGFGPDQVRTIEAGPDCRLDPEAVRAAVARDRAPFCLVATAGTTSTGAADPLPELAAVCREHGLWLHVDGAYGAPAALCGAVQGLEHADSLVLDPHKWLFQPYEAGCALVREPGLLERTFGLNAAVLRDTVGGEVDFRDRSVQLSRTSRALKLWLSLRVFGVAGFRDAIAHGIALAEHAESVLRSRRGWEVVSPAQLAIVCFRHDGDDARQTAIAAAMIDDGYALPSTTEVGGRVALRLCTMNPRTTFEEIDRTIERMEAVSRSCA